MIKLYIVYLVCCLGLESLINKAEFFVSDPKFLVVEYASESGVGHKSTFRFIFILEEWFDKKSAVSNVSSDSLKDAVKLLLFTRRQSISWIKNRRNLEVTQSFLWAFLKIFFSENLFDFFVEVSVSYFGGVFTITEMVLQLLIFFSRQLQVLCVKGGSEFGCFEGSFS